MNFLWLGLVISILGLIFAGYLVKKILKKERGTPKMRQISDLIKEGAIAFLYREYKTMIPFILILGVIIFFGISKKTALSFLIGALCSILTGYIGMQIATRSNDRTAWAAKNNFLDALNVAFPGGMVMGLCVSSLGLLGLLASFLVLLWHASLRYVELLPRFIEATQLIMGFSMGASMVALFSRVGGGIYTKAADVGADLVGKVEVGIPEDDPRNPAVIADNVGDNVGDVAGMGADLFESYVGAIISAMVISSLNYDLKGIFLTILIAGWGILSSIIGYFFVRAKSGVDPQKALMRGLIVTALSLLIGSFLLCLFQYKDLNVFWAICSGLVAGMVVGFSAEYFTSGKVVRKIAESSQTGAATNIIEGIAVGMQSTVIPLIFIAFAMIISYKFAGMFGVAISAVGMLSVTGMTVAVDAYGPIADNSAGIAEMAGMGGEVRRITERLDAVGNTTAAIGKGFAIGSAALTALALFSAYISTVGLKSIDFTDASVIAGAFIGGVIPFIFTAITLRAVRKSASKVVEEVRRQFKEIPGLIEGKSLPDSASCVDITTRGALKEMIVPGIIAICAPLIIGILLGPQALGGFLIGSLITGVPLAIFLANSGGAWDNAKKYVEEGNLGGKGSDVHKATVVGDTVGDPFKDTAGPSINILLKLMSIVALVFGLIITQIHTSLF